MSVTSFLDIRAGGWRVFGLDNKRMMTGCCLMGAVVQIQCKKHLVRDSGDVGGAHE